jgi:hypothetical protein
MFYGLSISYKKLAIVPVFLLALSFLIFKNEFATGEEIGVIYTSESKYEIPNLTVVMQHGIVTVTATSKAAEPDNSIRYLTVGFTVSTVPSDKYGAHAYNLQGKNWTGPAAPSSVGEFMLSDENRVDEYTIDGMTTTVFQFDVGFVNSQLSSSLNTISNDTVIYLSAIFRSYEYVDEDTKIFRSGAIRTWEDMMYAEPWSYGSLEGFAKYYNMELKFAPGPQPVELHYVIGSNIEDVKNIGYRYIGEYANFTYAGISSSLTRNDKEYVIKGFYATPIDKRWEIKGIKIDGSLKSGVTEWYGSKDDPPGTILDTIVNDCAVHVPWGGINVYIVYDKIPDETNVLYYRYKNTTEIIAKLPSKTVGEQLSWSEKAIPANETLKRDKKYKLIGYYVLRNLDEKKVTSGTIANGLTEEDILHATVTVEKGGMKVYLEYADTGDVPVPPPIPTTEPKPTLPPFEQPDGGYDNKPKDNFTITGEIRADLRGQERFNVLAGIPTTESLYTQIRGNQYNIGYYLNKKVVIKEYPITIQKDFILRWTDAKDKTKVMEETVPVKQTITVKRACAYWEISYLDYYKISKAVIYNKALPGGSCTMYPNNSYYRPPELIVHHMGREEDHIIKPPQAADGYVIMLDSEELQGDGVKPTIPSQDFTYEANVKTEEMKIINDFLSFGGTVVLNGGTYTKEAPELTNTWVLKEAAGFTGPDALYKPDQVIPATILNEQYPSTGTITYVNHPSAVNPSSSTLDLQVNGLNSVIVHTPVICDASITTTNTTTGITSNDPYVQALNIDQGCLQLVLDTDSNLSDFTVDINNYGSHLSSPGYFTRDFAWGLRDSTVSYIAKYNNIYRNEVKFPFDVFYRNPSGKDEFIPKNTWMRFGHNTPTFYLPMWINEGIYTVDFRTIAVNGVNSESQLSKTQAYANIDRSNYVATDTVRVQVSGRLYGLTLYDVTDYPTWETVFRVKTGSARLKINEGYPSGVKSTKYNEGYAYDYTIGLKDQYGNTTGRLERLTLPLVNGSHPKINNVGVLKTGYAVKFKVTTIGNAFSSGDSVTVKPRFYYVDAEGKNRREVDVYYNDYFNHKSYNYVRVGSALDQTNIKKYRCGDQWLAIPDKQLQMMAEIKKISVEKYKWQDTDLFTYSTIRITSPLMTYVNTDYLLDLKAGDQYAKIRAAGITDTDIVNRMQTYYAEYFLPADIFLVEKGFDVAGYMSKYGVSNHESFWLKGGYLIINFDIYTTRGTTKNISYLNTTNSEKGYCSMWEMEGAVSGKVSYNGRRDPATVFKFQPGDFMIYFSNKSVKDDYVPYIID